MFQIQIIINIYPAQALTGYTAQRHVLTPGTVSKFGNTFHSSTALHFSAVAEQAAATSPLSPPPQQPDDQRITHHSPLHPSSQTTSALLTTLPSTPAARRPAH